MTWSEKSCLSKAETAMFQ